MARGRTPVLAVQRFVDSIQTPLKTVSRAVVPVQGGYHPSLQPHVLAVNNGRSMRLRGQDQLHLEIAIHYKVEERLKPGERWQAETTGYYYTFMDAYQREIVGFHWHPVGRSSVVKPHLHLGPGAQIGYERLHRAHVPTGPVSIQDVLRFAIVDLGVEPLIDLETALQILATTPEP